MNVFSDVTYIELIIKRIVMQYSENGARYWLRQYSAIKFEYYYYYLR